MIEKSEFLEPEEITALTGCKQPSAQCRWLTENGINYFINNRGTPIIGRQYLRQRMAGEPEPEPEQTTSEKLKAAEHRFLFRGLNKK